MSSKSRSVAFLFIGLACSSSATMAGPTFVPLGFLDPTLSAPLSAAHGVSADGRFIVGGSYVLDPSLGGPAMHAFRWSASEGFRDLGLVSGSGLRGTIGRRVSASGSVVVGSIGFLIGGGFEERNAAYWTVSGGAPTSHLLQSGDTIGYFAADVSADGSLIVGGTRFPGPEPVFDRAFSFTESGGFQILDTRGDQHYSYAAAASGDGAVIVGSGDGPMAIGAWRWTAAGGFEFLGGQASGVPAEAAGISADGSTIVGEYDSVAAKWTAAGGFVALDPLPGASIALDASAHGELIVGYRYLSGTERYAFVWDAAHGMRDLRDVLLQAGLPVQAWTLSEAEGVLDDGLTIVGTGTDPLGRTQGWVVTLGSACYANCDGSTAAPVLNVNDFLCFQSRFAAGDSYANCDGSTIPPVLNVNDFLCFQSRFAAGCP